MKRGRSSFLFALVLLAGFLLAALSPSGPALAGPWGPEATGGMGNANNGSAWSSAVFNSRVYVGTVNVTDGLEVYSFDGENWNLEVGVGGPEAAGFGGANVAAACMAVYDSQLYVGTGTNGGLCEVWRYDGTAWTQVVGALPSASIGPGFGVAGNVDALAMAVYGNELFVSTRNNATGVEVWRYDGATWAQSVGNLPSAAIAAGFGSANNETAFDMCAYREYLYVGTSNSTVGCEVWRFNGATWVQSVGTYPSAIAGPGFGNAANVAVKGMQEYMGALFMGTQNGVNGCEVWAIEGTICAQSVGGQPTALIASGFGNAANANARSMHLYDSRLYVGTSNGNGCEVWSLDPAGWSQEVGGGPAGDPTGPGFGDAVNLSTFSMATFNDRLFIGTSNNTSGCQVWSKSSSTTWYLAEGATANGFETYILVQNPNPDPVDVALSFQTSGGPVPGPIDTVPGLSRVTYLVNNFVPDNLDVSTTVKGTGDIVCERAMYWTSPGAAVRRVAHDSIGVVNPSSTWYMAEGATTGGYQTFILVQNPNPTPVNIDMKFQTDHGPVQGPQEALGGYTRKTYPVDIYATTYDVSTMVTSYMGDVICERAVYFTPPYTSVWDVGTDSIGVVSPSDTWYLAEGATAGHFDTWLLVQNPNPTPVTIDIQLQTDLGAVPGPGDPPITVTIAAQSRESYLLNDWVSTYDVSTKVTSTGGAVICERAMYEAPITPLRYDSGHDSIGTTVGGLEWFLPEGTTAGGFETWVLVQNPNSVPVDIAVSFLTGGGEVAGPVETIPANTRKSYFVGTWVPGNDNVSTRVTSTAGGFIICERAVYWKPFPDAIRYFGTDSIGYRP